MAGYNFNVKLREGKFDVQVDTAAKYGYFEHDELGDECGGGLWFEVHESSKQGDGHGLGLVDVDGTSELPKEVIKALRDAGFIVPKVFG